MRIAYWMPYILCGAMIAADLPIYFKRRPGSARKDKGSFLILMGVISAGFWCAFSTRRGEFGEWALWAAPAITVSGIAFRLWAIRTLGKFFTPVVRTSSDQAVVQAGPYRLIRHPSYTGSILAGLGVGVALGSLRSVAIVELSMALGLGYRILVEERALAESLGEPYREYMRRTWRLIPYLV